MAATRRSPMVYSSMIHVAGGEGGSIRHDDDGRPAPSGGSPLSEGRGVGDEQVATMIDMSKLCELSAALGSCPPPPTRPTSIGTGSEEVGTPDDRPGLAVNSGGRVGLG